MSQLCIVLQSSVHKHHQSKRALRFCQQLMQQRHKINCLFFYRQAVDHASTDIENEALEIQRQWQAFAKQYDIPLVVCHTVAERKGLNGFAERFDDAGLTALVSAMASADRTLQL